MKINQRWLMIGLIILTAFVVSGGTSACTGSTAGGYPTKDIEIIVPYRAGGGFDLESRMVAAVLPKYLPNKVNVVVNNVAGAGGKTGTDQLMKSKADGYVMGIQDPIGLGVLLARNELGSVKAENILALARVDAVPAVIVVGANSKYKSFNDFKGQKIRFAGQTDDILTTKLLGQALGADVTLTTFDGLPESCLAVARGDADAAIGPANSIATQIKSLEGKLKAVIVIGQTAKLDSMPDVPTASSLSFKIDESVFLNSKILIVPPGTPEDVRKVLAAALEKALKDPDFIAQMTKAGYVPSYAGGTDLQKQIDGAFATVKQYESLMPK